MFWHGILCEAYCIPWFWSTLLCRLNENNLEIQVLKKKPEIEDVFSPWASRWFCCCEATPVLMTFYVGWKIVKITDKLMASENKIPKAALLSSPRLTAAAKLLPNQYTAARLKSTDNVFCRRRSNMCLICTDWAEGIMGQELGHENRITIQKAKSSLEIRALRC